MRVVLVLLGSLAVVSCGSQRTIKAHGMSIELPNGWVGRIVQPEPGFATHVVAGNFEVPAAEDWLGPETSGAMRSDSIYVWLALQPVFEGVQEGQWLESALPVQVGTTSATSRASTRRSRRRAGC